MNRKAVLFTLLLALTGTVAHADSIVVSNSASSSTEDHSSRQTVSLGSDLAFEEEHFGPPATATVTIPLTYSIPTGFALTSAILEFTIDGSINTFVSGGSVPVLEDTTDFAPASLNPTIANAGPLIVVSIGDQSFQLMSDITNGSTAVDLIALGYGDLLMQGAPVSIWGSVTLFSFIEASPAPWWGTNAFTQINIDQYWSGDFNATLTLGTTAVPEPNTLLLVGIGVVTGAGWIRKRNLLRA